MRYCSALILSLFLLLASVPLADSKETSSERVLGKLDTFSRAFHSIRSNYVNEVSAEALLDAAISGMTFVLDPHSLYMPPSRYEQMQVSTSGRYGGVGLEVVVEEAGVRVITPIEDSPAYKAGIKPGDVILEIDGRSTKGIDPLEIENLLKGPDKSSVSLLIHEKETGINRLVDIHRAIIRLRSATTERYGDFAIVKITSFQERTAQQVRRQLVPLISAKKPVSGIIFDFRNNPGGLLDEAIQLSDMFISNGVIVSTHGRRDEYKEVRPATPENTYKDIPLAVVINGGTASAPEIVAGALQDHQRAVIIGTRSFGKGSVQTIIDLNDGSAMKLTVATYRTPNGHAIQARGIAPDIVIDPNRPDVFKITTPTVREEDLQNHLDKSQEVTKNYDANKYEEDIQMQRAIDHMRAWVTFSGSRKVNTSQKKSNLM